MTAKLQLPLFTSEYQVNYHLSTALVQILTRLIQTSPMMALPGGKTYIVEHLDPELGPWSELEYIAIAKETRDAEGTFLLSSLPQEFNAPDKLRQISAFKPENRGVEELYAADKSRVCLLDPAAASDLSPEDGDKFDAFLFGGILGDDPPRGMWQEENRGRPGCIWMKEVANVSPTDRTSELRKKGFEGRRLGPKQMTTDTAVRVTRIVVEEKSQSRGFPGQDVLPVPWLTHCL